MKMLAKIKQLKQKIKSFNFTHISILALCIALGMSMYAPETFAVGWATSGISKLKQLCKLGIKVGKIICGGALTFNMILWMFNRANWKWTGYAMCGGAGIAAVSKIVTWVFT